MMTLLRCWCITVGDLKRLLMLVVREVRYCRSGEDVMLLVYMARELGVLY